MFYRHCLKVIFTLNFYYLDFCPFPKVFSIAFATAQLSITTTFSSCCRCVSSRPWGNEIHNNPYVSHINRSTAQLQPYCSQKRKLINNTTSKTNSQGGYFILFPYSSRAHVWSYHWLCRAITCLSASHVRRLGCSKISRQDWDNHPSCLLRLGYFEFVLEDNTCFRKFRSRDVKGIPLALLL